jgi:hypothetical protein
MLFRKHCALDISCSGGIKAHTILTWTPDVGVAHPQVAAALHQSSANTLHALLTIGLYTDVKDI